MEVQRSSTKGIHDCKYSTTKRFFAQALLLIDQNILHSVAELEALDYLCMCTYSKKSTLYTIVCQ